MAAISRIVVILDRFPQIVANMPISVDRAVERAARNIEAEAKARAPRLKPGTMIISPRYPGQLADSIRTYRVAQQHWRVEATAEYAGYVEFGTHEHGAAQPFMTPAAHNVEPGFQADVVRSIVI